jgi:hypothetical protein
MGVAAEDAGHASLPPVDEAPVRERLRWEKELLGLYLSEHPMGEVAGQIGQFVDTWSPDLKDDSNEGRRVVVGGIVTGVRTVITKAKATMAIVTLEDLQGAIEVVVFPRLHEQTAATWVDGAILLVAGRVDHRGDEVSLLADLVMTWEEAQEVGPTGFHERVAAGDRGRRRSNGDGAWRNGNRRAISGVPNGSVTNGSVPNGSSAGTGSIAAPSPVPPGPLPSGSWVPPSGAPGAIPPVSPLRGSENAGASATGASAVGLAGPPGAFADPPGGMPVAFAEPDDDPPLPMELEAAAVVQAGVPTTPLAATPGRVLNVRFAGTAPDRAIAAMQAFREVIRERPGETRVMIHIPAPGGSALPMELRPVAYDAELIAELQRRVGADLLEISLA